MERTETELSFLGSTPPVHINADSCGVVTVNYKIVLQSRDEDTLRKESDRIEREQQLGMTA
ncbi:MAG: hypothetical protein EOL92_00390 [Bacteroidia bacterium]|nr:hypothetical protein [Bacteroidia bacterium]